jgi:hypothetical protein
LIDKQEVSVVLDVNDLEQISPSINYILKSMKLFEKSSSLVSCEFIKLKDQVDYYGNNFDQE